MDFPLIYLRDRSPQMVAAWHEFFDGVDGVNISEGEIFGARADVIVSPANSFGYMDGGIDLVYIERFGRQLQYRLQALLTEQHDGELPVGQAVFVETGDAEIPYMISAPTMRIPQRVHDTLNASLAFRAVLRAAKEENLRSPARIKTILCPGLCTAIGKMPYRQAAQQMLLAYLTVAKGRRDFSNRAMKMLYNHGALLNCGPLWSDEWQPRKTNDGYHDDESAN